SPSRPRAIIARQARRRRSASSLVLKCKAMGRTSGPRRLAVPPEQGAGAEDGDGDTDQERADRGDGGIDLQEEAVPHPHGQRLDLDSGEEQRDQQLVERGEEREERRREYAGHDQRQRHPPERGEPARPEAERGLLEPDVEPLQGGRDDDHYDGQRQHRVAQGHGQDAAGGLEPREEEVEADRRDNRRHDHRREQEGVDRPLATESATHQRQRREEPEHGGEHHGEQCDLGADPDGLPPGRDAEEALVPSERQAGWREAQVVGAAERDDEDDDHRGDEEQEYGAGKRGYRHGARPRPLTFFAHQSRASKTRSRRTMRLEPTKPISVSTRTITASAQAKDQLRVNSTSRSMSMAIITSEHSPIRAGGRKKP